MRKKIAKKWVKALRSGDYDQGDGMLRDKQGNFCCLGVLCNLHAQTHPKIAAKETDPLEYLGRDVDLPDEVQEWAEMNHTDGVPRGDVGIHIRGNYYSCLATANDEGVDFEDIADWIEENYEKL